MDGKRQRHGRSDRSDEAGARGLRRVALFRDVPEDELAALEAAAERHTYAKDRLIVKEGDARDGVWALVAGGVHHLRESEEGQEIDVGEFGPGDVFGLFFLGADTSRDVFQATSDGTVAYHIPRERFRAFAASHPEIALRAVELLGSRHVRLLDQLEEVAVRHVAARVAHLLAERAEREDDLLVVRLTQQEIAALVASTRDPVAKGIRRLRELGLIETRRGRVGIVVGDRQALADFRDESL